MSSDTESAPPGRALILAGGGLKVAFQAGVLQVWLDEAQLEFDYADGASGGTFNLAMYCQQMSGTQIADNWRNLRPMKGVTPNWKQLFRGPYAASLLTMDGYRQHVFPRWGLDWQKIRATERQATFNLYNFSKNELSVVTPIDMDEDHLVAAVSLPMWFPPVTIHGDTYIDPVYVTDANIGEAVRRGYSELWIIWTVSERRRWYNGFIANYFQVIETAANSRLQEWLNRIEANNTAIASQSEGEFGRTIEVKLLRAEVPLNYLVNLTPDRFTQAVELGVQAARQWCREQEPPIALTPSPPPAADRRTQLRFTERMAGSVRFGGISAGPGTTTDAPSSLRREANLSVLLTIDIGQLDNFVISPEHEASVTGEVVCEALGGQLPVEWGTFNLFVEEPDPEHLRMLYRLWIRDKAGHRLTLVGVKYICEGSPTELWAATTTLHVKVLRGHVKPEDDSQAEIVASGIIRIHLVDFLKQLASFRIQADSVRGRVIGALRFGALFTGKLWDVYAQPVLTWSPF
jgi:predicted acylesterase/phospholipase RssA